VTVEVQDVIEDVATGTTQLRDVTLIDEVEIADGPQVGLADAPDVIQLGPSDELEVQEVLIHENIETGFAGPPGPPGPGGAGSTNLYIQDTNPNMTEPGVWWETDGAGNLETLWVETDGA